MGGPVSPLEPSPPVPVPRTNRNPIRSLRPTSVVIAIGATEVEIPPYPAVDWLEVLMVPDWNSDDVILDLVPGGMELLMDRLDVEEAHDLVLDIIEEVSGRHWWIALRLINILASTWDVMGAQAIFHHVDAEKLSLAAWMDAMLFLLVQRLDKDQGTLFVSQLEAPPMGEEIPVEEMEISEQQFLSMAG